MRLSEEHALLTCPTCGKSSKTHDGVHLMCGHCGWKWRAPRVESVLIDPPPMIAAPEPPAITESTVIAESSAPSLEPSVTEESEGTN